MKRIALTAVCCLLFIAPAQVAHADPVLTAKSTVGADGSVSFESIWNCVSPYRTCSYGWRWLNGTRLGVTMAQGTDKRFYFKAAGYFPAGCHTVENTVTYFVGNERTPRRQVAYTSFCI